MIPIKEYYCESTPTYEEIKQSKVICNLERCVVLLKWFVPYNGWDERFIDKDTDIDKLDKNLRNIVYGI